MDQYEGYGWVIISWPATYIAIRRDVQEGPTVAVLTAKNFAGKKETSGHASSASLPDLTPASAIVGPILGSG